MIWGAAYESTAGNEKNLKLPRSKGSLWYGMPTHHQAMFFRRDVFASSRFDCRYRIAADYKLVCEIAAMPSAVIRTTSAPVCVFDLSGTSSRNYWAGLREQQTVRRNVLGIGPIRNLTVFVMKSLARLIRTALPTIYGVSRYGDR
jgi:putative colanic acid biosynthesis glycosyltransferase